MASNSRKYICPCCYRSARATCSDIILVCGHCDMLMKYVKPYGAKAALHEESLKEDDHDEKTNNLD